jgi:hypothetical protein
LRKEILTFAASIIPEWAALLPEISLWFVLHSFQRQGIDETPKPASRLLLHALQLIVNPSPR